MNKKLTIALLLAVAASVSARAQGGLSIGGHVGTLGPGVELTGYLLPQLNVRVSGNYLAFSYDGDTDDVDYKADLRFASVLGTLDWFPFENNFRISAGLAANNNKIKLKGDVNEPTEIGDHEYTPSQIGTLKGEATFDDYAPYLGVGFGNSVADDAGLSFVFDLGVVFQGTPDVTLDSNGSAAGSPQFKADLKKEEDNAQDEADHFKIYPVLSFGIAYYFW